MNAGDILGMNGYALYVWGAYGLGFVVYVGVLVHALVRYDRLKKRQSAK